MPHFVVSNGTKTFTIMLLCFFQSRNVAKHTSLINAFPLELAKIPNLLLVLHVFIKLKISGAKLFNINPLSLWYKHKQKIILKSAVFTKRQTFGTIFARQMITMLNRQIFLGWAIKIFFLDP